MSILPSGLFFGVGLALVIVLVGWYVVAARVQRAKATRLARLASRLLRPIGTEGSFRWLGGSGAELRLTETRRPFRGMRAVIWLQPRELLPAAIMGYFQNRRDLLAIAADLIEPPRAELELLDPSAPVGLRALLKAEARGWPRESVRFAERDLTLTAPDLESSRQQLARLAAVGPPPGGILLRLALSPHSPQLSLSLGRPERLDQPNAPFASWLKRLAQAVA